MLKKISNILIWSVFLIPCLYWFQNVNWIIFPKMFLYRIFIELLLICYLLLLAKGKIQKPKLNFINVAFGIFVLISLIMGFIGKDPARSFWGSFERFQSNFDFLHYWVLLLILPCFIPAKEKWLSWLKNLNISYLFISFVLYIFYILNIFGMNGLNGEKGRWTGFAGNSIFMSVFLLINIFLGLYLFFESIEKGEKKWIFLISPLIFTFLLFQTGCRGSLLSLALCGFLFLLVSSFWKYDKFINLYHLDNRKISRWILLSLVLLILLSFPLRKVTWLNQFTPIKRILGTTSENVSVANRLAVFRTSILAFVEKPLFGWGPSNYDVAYQNNFDPEMVSISPNEFRFDKAHNMYLEIAVTTGIFGLLSYLVMYYSVHFSLKQIGDDIMEFFPKLILIFLLLAYIVQNLFVFDVFEGFATLMIIFCFVSSVLNIPDPKAKIEKNQRISSLIVYPLVLAICFCIYKWNIKEIAFLNGYRDDPSYLREFTVLQEIRILNGFSRPFTALQQRILDSDEKYLANFINKYPTRWRGYLYYAYLIDMKYQHKDIPKDQIDIIKQSYLQAKQNRVALPDYEQQYNKVLYASADINDKKAAELNIFFLKQKYPKLNFEETK